MTRKQRDNRVGPWAKEKLDALGQYLSFYTTVLKHQHHWLRGTVFVDAFAGPGLSQIRTKAKEASSPGLFGASTEPDNEELEFLKGSPRVALDMANPFSLYIFVDNDSQRVAELTALKSEYAGRRTIDVQEGDASTALKTWLSEGIDWSRHRAVVFLDPFGMQVPWSTIEALGKTKAIEVIVNFPLGMAIQRLLKKSGDIPEGWQISLDVFFGSPDWRNLAYEESTDLFGPKKSKASNSAERLLQWYRGRLKAIFGHVSTPRLIKNTRGNPLYYLIWAGPNKKGLEGANYILGKERNTRLLRARRIVKKAT
jgi:three-Cys-motif partner protein